MKAVLDCILEVLCIVVVMRSGPISLDTLQYSKAEIAIASDQDFLNIFPQVMSESHWRVYEASVEVSSRRSHTT